MKDSLDVYVDNRCVGELFIEDEHFIYHYKSVATDKFISLTMPVRDTQYLHNKLHPLFEMHLPEGYLLSIIKKHFSKIEKMDDFNLLKAMSQSVKGRVHYKQQVFDNTLTLDDLLYSQKEHLFEELVNRFALYSPISGVQPKVIATIEDKASLQCHDFIVKSWGAEYPELALNEYFCMSVVKEAGVVTPEFYLSDDRKLFIMKRFDVNDNGAYLGFEDMCVLQAKGREDKYEGSYESIAKTIKIFVSPKKRKRALCHFFKMIVLNNILKNGDAHLKNFGLLYSGIDDIDLAPAYDVVCTTSYIKSDIPALHLLGSKKWQSKKMLLRFGIESCLLSKGDSLKAYEACEVAYLKIKKEFKNSKYDRYLECILLSMQ
jgi:serine/threonine-protein kinase HipA